MGRMTLYLTGLGDGMMGANVEAKMNKAPLFCPPEKLPFTPDLYRTLLETWIKSHAGQIPAPYIEESPIGVPLLQAFRETFPCSQKSN